MFSLEVEYLMGRALASSRDDRTAVEWPPHPVRLFSALVAAYEECDLGNDARAALAWLETLPEPRIYAMPPHHEGCVRDVHKVFVPVNGDDANEQLKKTKEKVSMFPVIGEGTAIRRKRDNRWFPAFTPQDRHVWFIWNDTPEMQQHAATLQRIAENVTYLGHSMSPVRVRVSGSPPEPTLIPDRTGALMLRTTGRGRLRHLEETYQLRKENTTIQPRLGRITRYHVASKDDVRQPASLFGHAFVFQREAGIKLPIEATAILTAAVRKAVLDLYPDPVPEIVSGHDYDCKPSAHPHLAVTSLPDVGHRYADGHIMGFALWLPVAAQSEILETLEDALAEFESLVLGRLGVWKIRRVTADIAARTATGLRLATYTRPHDVWASVTPVVFGRFPKKSQVGFGKDGGRVFAEMCEMIGLPKPIEARIGPVSVFDGGSKASEFSTSEKFEKRFKAHVWIRFAEPVKGPVLIGAGRFVGFGLCRPWFEKERS